MRGDYQQRPGTNTQRTTGLARHNPPFSQSSQQKKARDPKGSRESSLRAYRLVLSTKQEAAFIGRFYRALGATADTWRKAPNLILSHTRKAPSQEGHKTTGAPAFCTRALLAPHSGACVLAARPPSATPEPVMRPPTLRARRRAHAAIAPAPALRGRLGRRSRSARGGAQEARPYEVGRQASLPRARACGALTSCASAFSATSACAASSFSSWRGKARVGRPRGRQGSPQRRSRHDS